MAFLPIVLVGIAGGALYLNRSRPPSRPDVLHNSNHIPPPTHSNGRSHMAAPSPARDEPFHPSLVDVLVVKAMLIRGLVLPPEIVEMIINHADYWACTETSMEFPGSIRISGGKASSMENQLLIRSPPIGFTQADVNDPEDWRSAAPSTAPPQTEVPQDHFRTLLKAIPALEHPVRKVVFKIRAKDQGWGGTRSDHDTFHGSWTWFEAGLERFDQPTNEDHPEITPPFNGNSLRTVYPRGVFELKHNGTHEYKYPLGPDDKHTIQRNRTAVRQMADYEVTWSWTDGIDPESAEAEHLDEQGRGKASGTGEFVRSLRLGDVISIWGNARFGGWANNVEKVSVQVYWAL